LSPPPTRGRAQLGNKLDDQADDAADNPHH
jgi:hypothetical protein